MAENKEVTVANLKKLREIADSQDKASFVAALDAAIYSLTGEREEHEDDNDMRLSTPADQLNSLAQKVRDTSLTNTQRLMAAHRLVNLGFGRR